MSEETFDTIVIGSGAGGLSAAICLAKAGQKVLVLEQHDVPGGWCHSFYLEGHRFSPGVHYIGLMEEGQSSRQLYEALGIADDLVFFRMNPQGYEHCWIGEERIDMPAGHSNLKEALSLRFPKERENINTYLDLVRNAGRELQLITKVRGLWEHLTIPFRTKNFGRNALKSVSKVIDKHIDDPLLKSVLNIQVGDHGRQPATASFPLHCAIMEHYFEGGYYPMGGGAGIVKAMTKALKSHGGQIRTRLGVKRILVEGGKKKQAIGVELHDGQRLMAKNIISNADPAKTYLELVGKDNLGRRLRKRLDRSKYSCTSLMLFLTVDMDVREAGLDSGNIWLMRDHDLDGVTDDLLRVDVESGATFPGMFLSCTTLKDPPSFDGRHHTIEAITYIDYASFERFEGEDLERSPAYLAFKEKLMEKMLSTVEIVLPNVRKHVVMKELGTPITNEYYINSTRGSVYGTEKSLRQIGPFAFKAKTPISGLYLCGASIHAHGVAGSGYSGLQTAAVILGKEADELLQVDGSQNLRIYDAEDPSEYPEWIQMKMKVRKDRQAVRSE